MIRTGSLDGAELRGEGAGGGRPLTLHCPRCDKVNAEDCPECCGRGEFEVKGKPSAFVTEDIWQLMDDAAATKATHHWPSGGSYLDETPWCYEGITRVWSEIAAIEAERIRQVYEK